MFAENLIAMLFSLYYDSTLEKLQISESFIHAEYFHYDALFSIIQILK